MFTYVHVCIYIYIYRRQRLAGQVRELFNSEAFEVGAVAATRRRANSYHTNTNDRYGDCLS